jgi:hypothetical protein
MKIWLRILVEFTFTNDIIHRKMKETGSERRKRYMAIRKKEWLAIADVLAEMQEHVGIAMDRREHVGPIKTLNHLAENLADVIERNGAKAFDRQEFLDATSHNGVQGRHKKFAKRPRQHENLNRK